MTATKLAVGTKVTVDSPKFPGIWTVLKVNPANYKLTQEATNGGRGRLLSAAHDFVKPLPADGEQPRVKAMRPSFTVGEIVRRGSDPTLYVVIADKVERVNVVKLGGDGGRYYREMPYRLTVVDPTTVLVGA